VKQSESNPLLQELARSPQAGPHPDSGMLAAFAEGTLLPRERQDVLAHLAACADCREVLSIVAGSTENPLAELKPHLLPRPSHPPLRAWLPWVGIAAGVIVVCSAGLLYQQRLALQERATVATNEAAPAPSAAIQQPPLSPSPERKDALKKAASSSTLKHVIAPPRPLDSLAAAAARDDRREAAKQLDAGQQSPSSIASGAGEQVTLKGVEGRQAASARSITALVNSEPARTMSKPSVATVTRPHWRINNLGQPECSFGDGAWRVVLPNEKAKMRVVSGFENEVWIGGDNTRLYHSPDNGATWNLVTLPEKNGREHVIAHIRFQTRQTGTVDAEDGTSWITTDGGSTWN
jgi:hypothetical protein